MIRYRYTALWLAGISIVVFLLQALFGTEAFLLIRSEMLTEPWRILTSIFAHSGIGHLFGNLFALVLFGLILEARIGSKRLFWLFLISGILINLVTPYERSLGASGAIYALIGALTILRPRIMMWAFGVPLPMILVGILYLIQDVIGAFIPNGVGNLAHIGGLIIGAGMGWYWRTQYGDKYHKKKEDPRLDRALDRWERRVGLR